MLSLKGRVALVTGAGPNIGRGIAIALAKAGASVVCNDLKEEHAQASAEAVKAAGGKAVAIAADISDPAQAQSLVERAGRKLGTIDILVNNAGVTIPRSLMTMTIDEWRKVTSVVLDGTFLGESGRRQENDRREEEGGYRQHCLDLGPSRPQKRHRLLHGQRRHSQFHPCHGAGSRALRHSRQFGVADQDRRVGRRHRDRRQAATSTKFRSAGWVGPRTTRTLFSFWCPTSPRSSRAWTCVSTAERSPPGARAHRRTRLARI